MFKSSFKKMTFFLLCLFTLFSFSACNNKKLSDNGNGNKIKVSVTFNALKEFVQAVGKDKVDISTVIPDGMEPHDFEPTARDLVGLSTAKIFVFNGLGMEAWADSAVKAADNKNLIAVDASKGVKPIGNSNTGETKSQQYDPHIWLSIKCAETEAKNIRDALVIAAPSDKAFFDKNCDSFISQLESLYSEYNLKFKTIKNKTFVTGHAAFAYLCRDFGLEQNSVEDVFAQGEPSPQKLASLIDFCKKNNVKTIFVENMVSPDVSQTLAAQVNAKVEIIYTFESNEDNKSYIERMRINLEEIYGSL